MDDENNSNKLRLENIKDIEDFPSELRPIPKEKVNKYISEFKKNVKTKYETIYHGFFNTMNELKCVSFENGYLLIVNRGFERILGYTNDEMVGEMVIKFIHPDDIESTINIQKYLLETNSDLNQFENRWRAKDGKYLSIEWNSTKVGEYYFSTGRIIENTNNFISKITHEIRNPLNSIVGFASLLNESKTIDTDDQENIQCIMNSCQHLTNIIDSILELKMISTGFNIESINLNKFLEEHLKIYQIDLSKKNLKLEYHYSYFDNCILFERKKLEQVFRNLICNAIKFNKNNGKIIINSELLTQENFQSRKIKITISDTGRGIDKHFLKKIFIPFEREYQNINGTGLGLSIVKKIVEIQDGTIDITSQKDIGTDVIMTFNLIGKVNEENNLKKYIINHNQNIIDKKLELLYVEDEESNIMLMEKIVKKFFNENINFKSAICSSEAIKSIKNTIPDILVLDYHLPDYDADELYLEIKNINGYEKIKMICIISANVKVGDMDSLKKLGIKKYLVKPITLKKVKELFEPFSDYFV